MKLRYLISLAAGAVALGAFFTSPAVRPLRQPPADCALLHTFDNGDTLLLCPASQEPLPSDTATEAAIDTDTPTATDTPTLEPTATFAPESATPTRTATAAKRTATPTRSRTPTPPAPTPTHTPTALAPTDTPAPSATVAPTPTAAPPATATAPTGAIAPYPSAPLCPDVGAGHDPTKFHTLWDASRGCHYDHEHGASPFTQAVAAAFPGFDLLALNCFAEIGTCVPSSPLENTQKHTGFKWQVSTAAPNGCAVGFEDGTVAIDAYAIELHAFGPPAVELEARRHTLLAMLRQCQPGNPQDKGYLFVDQVVDYGQRVIPYSPTNLGLIAPYPNTPNPAYLSSLGPYWSQDCVGADPQCRSSLGFIRDRNLNVNAIITSKSGFRVGGTEVVAILHRARDLYQAFDWSDQVYPFTFLWLCSNDGGETYAPQGCRYNNSTDTIHEIQGIIPSAWDNLAGFDSDPRIGRITASGYLDAAGQINAACTDVGDNCFPVHMVSAFVGKYSSEVSVNKVSNPTSVDTPERDIYFCGAVQCSETAPGAVPSGWIGQNN